MDPEYLAALPLTVIPGTPMARMVEKERFELPDVPSVLDEVRTFIADARPTNAVFRTNHASNYLPLGDRQPKDRDRIQTTIDAALAGEIRLRPDWSRGLEARLTAAQTTTNSVFRQSC